MDTSQLVATGLNETQAMTYALLLKDGQLKPPQLARELKLTRSNAYKVLDRLTELGLARREEKAKKFVYYPDNPLALTNLVAEQRNIATAREEAVKQVMGDLLASYHQHTEQPDVQVVTGRDAVAEAYFQQIRLQQPIRFIRSRADIPAMGFDTMHEIRVMPARHGQKRYGITPDMTSGPVNPRADTRSGLTRTWVRQEDYTAPVEWSVSGPTLLIVLFGSEPHAITISSPMIADAFRQLFCLLDSCLRNRPDYKDLPRTARS
jgi:predicted transcriptional regulator